MENLTDLDYSEEVIRFGSWFTFMSFILTSEVKGKVRASLENQRESLVKNGVIFSSNRRKFQK
jgi:hypothetical protein